MVQFPVFQRGKFSLRGKGYLEFLLFLHVIAKKPVAFLRTEKAGLPEGTIHVKPFFTFVYIKIISN